MIVYNVSDFWRLLKLPQRTGKEKKMNGTFNMLLSQFAAAWDLFFRVPLPAFFRKNMEDWETIDGQGALLVPMLPIVGAVAGLLLYIPLTLICGLGRPAAAGILGATIAPLLVEILTGGKDMRSLSLFFERRRKGMDVEEALTTPGKNISISIHPFLLLTLYVLRMILFGVLAYFHASFWFILVFAGAFYVKAELCLVNIPGEFGRKSLLTVPEGMKKYHTYIFLVISILAGLFVNIPFTVIGFLIALLAAFLAKGACLESLSGINKFAVRVFGYASEYVLLFTGVLLYAKPGA